MHKNVSISLYFSHSARKHSVAIHRVKYFVGALLVALCVVASSSATAKPKPDAKKDGAAKVEAKKTEAKKTDSASESKDGQYTVKKKPLMPNWTAVSTYSSQTQLASRTSRNPNTVQPRRMSVQKSTYFRLNRSATTPASAAR